MGTRLSMDVQENQQLVGLTELAAFSTRSAFVKDRGPEGLAKLYAKLGRLTDAEIAKIDVADPGVDCKPGCDFCCYRPVVCTPLEALATAIAVKNTYSVDQLSTLESRLDVYAEERSRHASDPWNARPECPLLVDGLCSVYESRPLMCRGTNSKDVGGCFEWKEHPEAWTAIPHRGQQVETASAFRHGIQMAADHLKGAVKLTELGPALQVILKSDLPPEAFLSGQEPLPSPLSSDRVYQRPDLTPFGKGGEPSGNPTSFPPDVLAFESAREKGEGLGAALDLLASTHGARDILRFVVPRTYTSQEEVDGWYEHAAQALTRLEESALDPAEAFDMLALHHTFEIGYTGRDVTSLMSRFGSWVSEHVSQALFPDLMEPIASRHDGPLKIGYISANLRNNNGSIYSLGWLENQSAEVEAYALNVGPMEDAISHRFRRAAHAYYHLPGPVPEAARFIKSLGLDALIYTDIGMAARNYQFASMRLAPVQCMGWGHPITSGLPNMDYFLTSDPMEPYGGEQHHTEKLVRLPRLSWCYPRPIPPYGDKPRDYFGLPEGFLPLMCQNLVKCLPKWDVLLKEISDRVGFVAVLEGQNKGDTRRTKERLERLGVNAIWVRPLTHYDYLRLQASCSVSLDTPAWSGGYTTLQALALGTPVVTMPGDFMRGRHSYAMLSLAGANGLIASTPEEFVEIACNEELQRAQMGKADVDSLFDDKQAVLNLERFLMGAKDNQVIR